MALAPAPVELPGSFFVLEYDRDDKVYILHVDDEDGSSYNLGDNIPYLMMRFRLWGCQDAGNRTIDMVREFGAAQCIPGQDRVIALFDRDKTELDVFSKERQDADVGTYIHL